jgi:predicted cupin superfamily sugar epimerase
MTTKDEIIESLGLIHHPEGGWYKEVYRSEDKIDTIDRNLLTSIYFLIDDQNVSNFHRIKSDELWFFHLGTPLTVHVLDKEAGHQKRIVGNDISKGESPQVLVKKDMIFGSSLEDRKGFALVSCAVAPGFDFEDFELFTKKELLSQFPNEEEIINKMTAT